MCWWQWLISQTYLWVYLYKVDTLVKQTKYYTKIQYWRTKIKLWWLQDIGLTFVFLIIETSTTSEICYHQSNILSKHSFCRAARLLTHLQYQQPEEDGRHACRQTFPPGPSARQRWSEPWWSEGLLWDRGEARCLSSLLAWSSTKCAVDLRLRLKLQVCFLFQGITEDPSTE